MNTVKVRYQLSKICVLLFAACLLAMDIISPRILSYLTDVSALLTRSDAVMYLVLLYVCNIPAWITLWSLYRLISAIDKGQVFTTDNVRRMRIVSLCCFAVALLCLVGAFTVYLPFLFVGAAAGFMGLIVRIVRDAFAKAIEMRDELDLTI